MHCAVSPELCLQISPTASSGLVASKAPLWRWKDTRVFTLKYAISMQRFQRWIFTCVGIKNRPCCGLDLKNPPKWWCIWKVIWGTMHIGGSIHGWVQGWMWCRMWGLVGGGYCGVTCKGVFSSQTLAFCFMASMVWRAFFYYTLLPWQFCLGASQLGIKPTGNWAANKPLPLLNCVFPPLGFSDRWHDEHSHPKEHLFCIIIAEVMTIKKKQMLDTSLSFSINLKTLFYLPRTSEKKDHPPKTA